MKRFLSVVILSLCAAPVLGDNKSKEPPVYEVNLITETDTAPTIDGFISEGEWELASAAAGDFVELRSGQLDTHNLRFRMLWDDENLYILGQTDFTGFGPPADDFDDPNVEGLTYNPNFFLDPNRDGEDLNERTGDDLVDGYQISWSMDEGFTSRRPTASEPDRALRDPKDSEGLLVNDYIPGLHLEAHVNTPFGNNGLWERNEDGPNQNYRDDTHPGLVFAQFADNDDVDGQGNGGGIFEWAIAWSALSATDPNRILTEADGDAVLERIPDPFNPSRMIDNENFLGDVGDPDPRFADPESEAFLENGLFAVEGPEADDVWAFELSAITPDDDNTTPSWSQPMGGDPTRTSLAAWGESGHGRLVFLGDPIDPLDCNEDGAVDAGDLTCVTTESLDPTLTRLNLVQGDFNGNGLVDFDDFVSFSLNFGRSEEVSYMDGDANVSGVIDFDDFVIFSLNFGKLPPSMDTESMAAAVPEPSSWILLVLGLAGLTRRCRRS